MRRFIEIARRDTGDRQHAGKERRDFRRGAARQLAEALRGAALVAVARVEILDGLRRFVFVAGEADHVELLHDDLADVALGLLGVLAQRERGVVVDVHRPEQGAVLEQHAEKLADLVEFLGRALEDVRAVDQDGALFRAE